MKIIITGGHLGPALATIEALPKDTQTIFVGRKFALEGDQAYSLEYQKITDLGIPFENVLTGRLQRKFSRYTIPSLLKLPAGFLQALWILLKHRPDILICFGGYVQVPLAINAWFLHIPIIIHEQTRKAGLANKLISHLAQTVCISWEESAKYFPKYKTILTGLPLRKEFFQETRIVKDNRYTRIYITGGSLGAHAINVLIEGCIEKLLKKYSVTHQTGGATEYNDYERLEKLRQKLHTPLQNKYKLAKFIDPQEAAQAMAAADLVISRAGMNTVAELMYLGKPCILIPLPHGQTNEQLDNAMFLEKLGLAHILRQEKATSEMLYSQITAIIDKLDTVRSRASEAKKLIKHDAAQKIVQLITQIYEQEKHQKK